MGMQTKVRWAVFSYSWLIGRGEGDDFSVGVGETLRGRFPLCERNASLREQGRRLSGLPLSLEFTTCPHETDGKVK